MAALPFFGVVQVSRPFGKRHGPIFVWGIVGHSGPMKMFKGCHNSFPAERRQNSLFSPLHLWHSLKLLPLD